MLGQFSRVKSELVPKRMACDMYSLYHQVTVVNQLSSSQLAALLLDPNSPSFEDESIVREVMTNLSQSQNEGQLEGFFQEFANISKQVTICFDGKPTIRLYAMFLFHMEGPSWLFPF